MPSQTTIENLVEKAKHIRRKNIVEELKKYGNLSCAFVMRKMGVTFEEASEIIKVYEK